LITKAIEHIVTLAQKKIIRNRAERGKQININKRGQRTKFSLTASGRMKSGAQLEESNQSPESHLPILMGNAL